MHFIDQPKKTANKLGSRSRKFPYKLKSITKFSWSNLYYFLEAGCGVVFELEIGSNPSGAYLCVKSICGKLSPPPQEILSYVIMRLQAGCIESSSASKSDFLP